jgi:uncharacterized protein YceH (UPF0502 family)
MQVLNAVEARVLGSLMEKQVLTPDVYPMTLRGLTVACNQKTSREPVMELADDEVQAALKSLMAKGLAHERYTIEGRVLKYSHNSAALGAFNTHEHAVLCLLLLRGPQTAGELRGRSERLAEFESVPAVEATLLLLAGRAEAPLVKRLPRLPGSKEARWAQLLTGEPEAATAGPEAAPAPGTLAERVAALEAKVAALEAELAALKTSSTPAGGA